MVASRMIFSDQPEQRRVRVVPAGTAPYTPLLLEGEPAISVTGRGNRAWTQTNIDGSTFPRQGGGVGLPNDSATVSFTGTYGLDVTGAKADTAQGTLVYLNTKTGKLTLTDPAADGGKWGRVEFFRGEWSATDTAVTIGGTL